MSDELQPSKKMWRTLIRVIDTDPDTTQLYIPAWGMPEIVTIPTKDIGEEVRDKITPSYRCFAHVNIGAESAADLMFDKWEAPE